MTSLIKQKTIRNETIFEGRALHAGVKSKIKLIPLECNKGILFVRKDKNINKPNEKGTEKNFSYGWSRLCRH